MDLMDHGPYGHAMCLSLGRVHAAPDFSASSALDETRDDVVIQCSYMCFAFRQQVWALLTLMAVSVHGHTRNASSRKICKEPSCEQS